MQRSHAEESKLLIRLDKLLDWHVVFGDLYRGFGEEIQAAGGHTKPPVNTGPFSLVGSAKVWMGTLKEFSELAQFAAELGERLGIDSGPIHSVLLEPPPNKEQVHRARVCLARIRTAHSTKHKRTGSGAKAREIAKRLKKARDLSRKGYINKEIAAQLRVSESTISRDLKNLPPSPGCNS